MVGCVQPFFITVSSKVGTGFEMYRNSKDVAPYIAVLSYDKEKHLYKVNKDDLKKANNFYLTSSQNNPEVRELNKDLINQTEGKENTKG